LDKGIGFVNVIWRGNELESLSYRIWSREAYQIGSIYWIRQMSGSWTSAIVDKAGNGYG
jgi:hypothetical protein